MFFVKHRKILFTRETHRGRWSASRAGCGGRWPHRWCSEPPDWAPSSRTCLSSPCGGWRFVTCALCVAGRQQGHGGRCGSSSSIATYLKTEKDSVRPKDSRKSRIWNIQYVKLSEQTEMFIAHWQWTCLWTSRPLVLLSVLRSSYSLSLTLSMIKSINCRSLLNEDNKWAFALLKWWQQYFLFYNKIEFRYSYKVTGDKCTMCDHRPEMCSLTI